MTKKQSSTKSTKADKQKTSSRRGSEKKLGSDSTQQDDVSVSKPVEEINRQGSPNLQGSDDKQDEALDPSQIAPKDQKISSASDAKSNRINLIAVIVGGVLFVALGFGTAIGLNHFGFLRFQTEPQEEQLDLSLIVSQQTILISELEQRLSNVQNELEVFISRLQTNDTSEKIKLLGDEIDKNFGELEKVNLRLSELSKRTEVLELQPIVNTVPEEIVEQNSKELQALKETLTYQQEHLQKVIDEAEKKETLAKEAAQEVRLFSEISRLSAAIENGQSYAAALADFEVASELKAPEILHIHSTTGFITSTQLTDQFPIAARMALTSDRSDGEASQGGTFVDYVKTQLKARSVTPREGMSSDAILSRAEAALKDGRLAEALEELKTLNSTALGQMGDWIAKAEARLAAVAYIDTIMAQIEK